MAPILDLFPLPPGRSGWSGWTVSDRPKNPAAVNPNLRLLLLQCWWVCFSQLWTWPWSISPACFCQYNVDKVACSTDSKVDISRAVWAQWGTHSAGYCCEALINKRPLTPPPMLQQNCKPPLEEENSFLFELKHSRPFVFICFVESLWGTCSLTFNSVFLMRSFIHKVFILCLVSSAPLRGAFTGFYVITPIVIHQQVICKIRTTAAPKHVKFKTQHFLNHEIVSEGDEAEWNWENNQSWEAVRQQAAESERANYH